MRPAALFAALLAISTLSGCFFVEQPVVTASNAVAVPGLPGTYKSEDGELADISADGNAYVMSFVEDGDIVKATIMAAELGGSYLVQFADASGQDPGFVLIVATVDDGGIRIHFTEEDMTALAAEHGLTISGNANLTGGDDSAILSFMAAYAVKTDQAEYILFRAE